MNKINLENVTLSCIVGRKEFFESSFLAVLYSTKDINFGKVQLLSCVSFYYPGIECIQMPEFSLDEYNKFMIDDYHKYINTDYVLHVQYDGFVINAGRWEDDFLNYDYIGALWPENHIDDPPILEDTRVGNGGFTLRSKKLLVALKDNFKYDGSISKRWNKPYNEDALICRKWRSELEKIGVKFAPKNIAAKFSIENEHQPEYAGQSFSDLSSIKTFGFHNKSFKLKTAA